MRYLIREDFQKQVRLLHRRGGNFRIAARKVMELVGQLSIADEAEDSPLSELNVTNHGETRIKHCVKYQLPGACRLITIQNKGLAHLAFVGNHDECDKWLDKNRGFTLITSDGKKIEYTYLNEGLETAAWNQRTEELNNIHKPLIEYLKNRDRDFIDTLEMPVGNYRKIAKLYSDSSDEELIEALNGINSDTQEFLLDVFTFLKEDDVDRASMRIEHEKNGLFEIEELEEQEVSGLKLGPGFIDVSDLPQEVIDSSFQKDWKTWMLYLHPDQKSVVDTEFNGPARLLGVSGSGKTCVLIHRAFELAKKYRQPVLVTTINEALADLLRELVDELTLLNGEAGKEIRELIDVKSFWTVCFDFLNDKIKEDLTKRAFDLVADKSQDDVDRIWEEFVYCEENNDDYLKILDLVTNLKSRGIDPHSYLKEEFSLVRSATSYNSRSEYLDLERTGRKIPFNKEWRGLVLDGLESWESKMDHVGVSDYMNLLRYMDKFESEIEPVYRCVLIDEIQDFGTQELSYLRKLAPYEKDDIFMCGDIAQQVQVKEHKLTKAGINVLPNNYLKIIKNFRNSREILEAANLVFNANIEKADFNRDEFELLNPQMANFSTQPPYPLKAKNLQEEIMYALNYMNIMLEENRKGCIAIAGMSHFEVVRLGEKLGYSVLNGEPKNSSERIIFSELNQTKGYEFDIVCILNLNQGVFPRPKVPVEERFRDISKLYVSMTRAKSELILSFSSDLSVIFEPALRRMNPTANWSDFSDVPGDSIDSGLLDLSPVHEGGLNGLEFVLKSEITLSKSASDALIKRVTGRPFFNSNGKQTQFKDINDLQKTLKTPRLQGYVKKLLGNSEYEELMNSFNISIEISAIRDS